MSHTHDTNGGHEEVTIVVGDELVTYDKVSCTCGKVMKQTIVRREKML